MRFHGFIADIPIAVFIDCGAAMNFLNPAIIHKLGLPITTPSPLKFTTASGHTLSPMGMAENITVRIQDYTFTDSFLLLPVAGCDLVLGAQWLDSLGFIGWHFLDKVMVFVIDGKRHTLKGISSRRHSLDDTGIMDILPADHLDTLTNLIPSTVATSQPTIPNNPLLDSLLNHYQELFTNLTSLPPPRSIDHRISLLPNTTPVNVRPYRYAHSQKTELESQVQDMLSQGIIRPSTSPFSSPVLLVKKKKELGDFVWITEASMQSLLKIVSRSRRWMNSWMSYMAAHFSPNWIYVQDIIKSGCLNLTYPKLPFELMMVITNS